MVRDVVGDGVGHFAGNRKGGGSVGDVDVISRQFGQGHHRVGVGYRDKAGRQLAAVLIRDDELHLDSGQPHGVGGDEAGACEVELDGLIVRPDRAVCEAYIKVGVAETHINAVIIKVMR